MVDSIVTLAYSQRYSYVTHYHMHTHPIHTQQAVCLRADFIRRLITETWSSNFLHLVARMIMGLYWYPCVDACAKSSAVFVRKFQLERFNFVLFVFFGRQIFFAYLINFLQWADYACLYLKPWNRWSVFYINLKCLYYGFAN